MANPTKLQVLFVKPDLSIQASSAGPQIKVILNMLLAERLPKVLKAPVR